MAGRSASIRDVAAMAGVSHQTVSRFLNQPAAVGPKTSLRIERAVSALGYHPNAAARALRSKHTRTVGVLVAPNSLFVSIDGLAALELALRRAGLRMLIAGIHGDDYAAMAAGAAPLLDSDVDVLVIAANQRSASDLAKELARHRLVVAMQPGVSHDEGLSSAAIDMDAAMADVVAHLVARGDRVLDLIPGPSHLTTIEARRQAWIRELGERGLPLRPLVPVQMTIAGGYEAGRRLLSYGLPDAVLAVNDLVAIGLLRAFREAGVKVPDDVAVVGTDDFVTSGEMRPSLSTVHQPMPELGAALAELVVEALDGRPARTVRIRPTLVVRESSSGTRNSTLEAGSNKDAAR